MVGSSGWLWTWESGRPEVTHECYSTPKSPGLLKGVTVPSCHVKVKDYLHEPSECFGINSLQHYAEELKHRSHLSKVTQLVAMEAELEPR